MILILNVITIAFWLVIGLSIYRLSKADYVIDMPSIFILLPVIYIGNWLVMALSGYLLLNAA